MVAVIIGFSLGLLSQWWGNKIKKKNLIKKNSVDYLNIHGFQRNVI